MSSRFLAQRYVRMVHIGMMQVCGEKGEPVRISRDMCTPSSQTYQSRACVVRASLERLSARLARSLAFAAKTFESHEDGRFLSDLDPQHS